MNEESKAIVLNGCEVLDSFLAKTTTRDYEPISTGITAIDAALGGGFTRGTLVMLGAAPGAGKTALAQVIFEKMAKAGKEAIFINLEMSPDQLIARSLSRRIYDKEGRTIPALEILRGYKWSEANRKSITEAAEEYRREVATNLFYMPVGEGAPIQTNKLTEIIGVLKEICEQKRTKGEAAPLICIDYLQLVDGEERDTAEGIKRTIMQLKHDIALKYNTVVFCIMAQGRAANKSGESDQESGRDTSAIEYSADVMLGLTYTAIDEEEEVKVKKPGSKSEMESEQLTVKTIRAFRRAYYEEGYAEKMRKKYPQAGYIKPHEAITLKVNKNRFGYCGGVNMIFDERHLTFKQADGEPFKEVPPEQLAFKTI